MFKVSSQGVFELQGCDCTHVLILESALSEREKAKPIEDRSQWFRPVVKMGGLIGST